MSIAQLAGQLARDERSVFLFRDYIHNANKYEEQDPFRNYLPYICQLQPLWVLLLEDSKRPAELAAAISEAFSLEFLSLLVDGGGESKSENAIALPIAALPWRMQKELLKYLDVPASLRQTSYDYDVFESPTLNFLAEHSGGALQFTSTSCLLIPDPLFYYLITFVNMIVLREDHLARMLDALEDTRRSFLSSAAFLQSSASIGGRTGGGAAGRPGGGGAAAPAKQAVHNLGSNFLTPFFAPTGRSFAQVQKGPGRARFGASEFVFTNRRESKIYEKLLIDYLYIFRSGGAGGGRENYMGAAMDQARTAQQRAGMVLRGRRGAGQRLLHCLMFDFWFASLAETFPAEERGGQGTASAAARIADPTIDLILHCNSILPVMRVALLHLVVENQPCVTDFIFLTERILRKMLTPGLLPPDLLHSDCLLQLLRTWLVVCQPWLATSLYPYYVFTFNQFGGLKGRKMLDVSQPEALIGLEPEALTHFRSSNDRFVSTAAGASGGRGGMITQTNQVDRILPDLDTWTGLGRSKLLDDLTYFSKNEIGFLMQQYHEAGSSTSSRAQGQAARAGTNISSSATNKQSSSSGGGGFFSWLLSGPSADARAAIGDSRASAATRLLNRALYGPSLDYLAFGFHTTAPAVSTTATFTAERYQAYVQQHWSLYALLKPFLRHPAFKELQKCCREKYHKVQAIIGQLPGGGANASARSGAAPGGTSSSSRGAASIFTTWRGHKLSGKDQLNIYNDFLALIFQTLQCFSEQALLQQLFFCQQSGVVPATKIRLRGEAVRMRTSLTQARALLNQPAPAGRSATSGAAPAEELFLFGRNRRSSEQVDQVTGALKNAQSSTEAAFGRPIADFYSSPAGPGTDGVVLVESLSNNVVEEAESAVSNLFDEAENFVHEVATNAQTLVETVDYVFGYDSASTFGASGDLPIMNSTAEAQLATPQLSRIAELPYSGGGASDPYTQSTRAGLGLLQQESSSVRVIPVVYGKDYARIMGEPHVLGAQGGWSDGSKESLVGWIFGKVFCCSACARRSSAENSAHVAVQQTRGGARGAGAPASATSSGAGIIPESRASTAPGAAAKHLKAPNSRQPHKTPNLHMLPARLYDAFPRLKHRLRHETIAWRRVFEGGARGASVKMSGCPDSPTQRAGRKYPRLDETCPVTEQFLFSEKKRMAARTGLQRSFASGSDPSGLLDFSGAGAGGVHHPYLNSLAVSPDKIQDANASLMTVARSSYHDNTTTTQMTQQPRRRTHNRGFEHVHFHGSSWTKPVRSYESAVLVYLLRQLSFVLDFLWRLGFGAVVSTAGAGGPGGELHPNIQWPRHLADLRLLSGFALVMAAALLFAAE
eukprot:g8845.t1